MGRAVVAMFVVAGVVVGFFGFVVVRMRQPVPTEQRGTSVVVLVDFSRSFVASTGLRFEDRCALKAVTMTMAELASSGHWTRPLKTVWTQIQTASITAHPLCAPLVINPSLVKHAGTPGTPEEIQEVLSNCVDSVIEASKNQHNLSEYTDISGAIKGASQIASGKKYSERVLIILSDFEEDLPPSSRQAAFKLQGERVILLHRPGSGDVQNVSGYLERVAGWKNKLLEHGAKAVVAMPVFAVSETRLRAALWPQDAHSGTALTVLVDFKENPGADRLAQIGHTLADLALHWPRPVTAQWMVMEPSGLVSKTLPPLEFSPSLVKVERQNTLNTVDTFEMAMEEVARGLPSMGRGIRVTDISGSLALACAVEPPAKLQVLVVISDFVDRGPNPPAPFELSPGTRVAMMHIASPADGADPNRYSARLHMWEMRFRDSGAATVCRVSLLSFTANDLQFCLGQNQTEGD